MPEKVKLDTLDRIEKELARVYRMAKAKKIASTEATKLTFMLQTLFHMHREGVVERELAEIKSRMDELE